MEFTRRNVRYAARVENLLATVAAMLACLLVLASLSGRASAIADDPKPVAEPKAVEFELLKSLHIAVQVKLNDAGPFRMIFDLGSPVNLVSGKAAAEAGLISKEAAKKPAFFGMRGESKLKKLEMGELTAEDMPVMIMDHPTLKAAAEFLGRNDGIVGYPLFARYKFTIDYPASTMTFTPGEYKPRNVMNQMMGRMFGGGAASKKQVISPGGLWGVELDKPAGDQDPGVIIAKVWLTSAAEAAGLNPGDRLLTIDGRWTDSVADVTDAASFVKAGEPVKLVVRRSVQELEIEVNPRLGL